jgi:uracil-DNA glycosylase family 4
MSIEAINNTSRELAGQYGLRVDCGGDGSFYAKIAIVSDYPGPTEVQRGLPMVGGAGRFLWDALRKFGINRTDCYTTTVAKRAVVDDGAGTKYALGKHELELWRSILIRELDSLPALEHVFVLGTYALEALLGLHGVSHWRGSVLVASFGNRALNFVIGNNPAAILRNPADEVVFAMDCRKLASVLKGS